MEVVAQAASLDEARARGAASEIDVADLIPELRQANPDVGVLI
jgi:hypothetical protein